MRAFTLSVGCSIMASACTTDIDRPPPPPPCTGSCVRSQPPAGGSSSGGGARDAEAMDARADGGGDAAATTSVSGAISVLQNEDFVTAADFTGCAEVGFEGPHGRVFTEVDGSTFMLDGVRSGSDVWADLQPISTAFDVPTTLQRIATNTLDGFVRLFFVRNAVMESIAQNLLVPVGLDATRAQAVLRFVDGQGFGVSSIQVTAHPGEVVAYDGGSGIFRDDFDVTAQSGLVAILNAPAAEFPGSIVKMSYGGVRTGTADVKLAQGAVTFVLVEVSP